VENKPFPRLHGWGSSPPGLTLSEAWFIPAPR